MSDTAAASLAGGLIAGGVMTVFLVLAAVWVLYIIAYWKVFTKMGEPGWKCIIPIYNEYVLFKRTWKGSMFWIILVVGIVGSVFYSLGFSFDSYGSVQDVTNMAFAIIASILMIVAVVLMIMSYYYLSKSFGHGIGFTIGLIFLSFIFVLVLAFGSSQYIGPKGEPQGVFDIN